ncbi:MAG: agmatinase [Gammaproteobacteria bacterium]|nr:agmatinase [Gammaproteobacteria bacterium]
MTSKLFGRQSNTHANIFTFLGLPLTRKLTKNVDAVVMGIPYDMATSARPGTRYGPNGIRQASAILRWEQQRWPWGFRLHERLHAIDYGDLDFDIGDSQSMIDQVIEHATFVTEANKFLLSLGGDHFVSLPLLRAVAKTHPMIALLHFDAHADTEKTTLEFHHGSMFYRALQEGIIEPRHSIQIGIRTDYETTDHPYKVLDANWANAHSADQCIAQIVKTCGKMPVYLTIDIDCLDPAFAPGTGTPVAGGLSSAYLLQVVRGLSALNIIAADIVEVSPPFDHADITSLAAATLATDILYLHASGLSAPS